ncbi:hypothetical protein D4N09_28810, partial [Escherichia coli]
AFWSVVWILQILNGRKCRKKLYELWCELTYLWHRVKPNLTVRSVPKLAKPWSFRSKLRK